MSDELVVKVMDVVGKKWAEVWCVHSYVKCLDTFRVQVSRVVYLLKPRCLVKGLKEVSSTREGTVIKVPYAQESLQCFDRDWLGKVNNRLDRRRQWNCALRRNAVVQEMKHGHSKLELGWVDYQAMFIQTMENLFQVRQVLIS